MREVGFLLFLFFSLAQPRAAEPAPRAPTNAPAPASELDNALRKLRVLPGFRAQIAAAEPLIQNVTSFSFDEQGRAYVVETHRRRTSVFDIRNHPDWLDDDFSFRTVADRSNFFRKVLVPGNTNLLPRIVADRNGDGQFDLRDLEVESERVRLLTDQNGDGVMDKAVTFADGFNTSVSGVAAGVLARQGSVYFACIPDLWLLRDTNNEGAADERKSLATGFGVHISFGGHDLHGLTFGPDGKLYFSIADRGLHVQSRGTTISNPDSGAVLRCNPDGSELELFATGLRNPQELAFDQYGNLWTGENNGDGGDKARWLYLAEGGDYGWHIGWQHLPRMGAWNAEALWDLPATNTATYLLPPIAHIGHGPAGLAFYPGTGLPGTFRNHFLLCDFPGGVHAFAVQPRGAGFEVYGLRQFVWELFPVDVDFGPEGGAYVLDWVQGWEKTGKGRLFRITEERSLQDPLIAQTKNYLAEGFARRSPQELGDLLAFPDKRVRQEAQFELAARGLAVTNQLAQIAAASGKDELARIHAIWALGQVARAHPDVLTLLFPLFDDPSPELRAQAARVLGDGKFGLGAAQLFKAARDSSPRVRFYGVLGLGKLGESDSADAIIQVLRENNDADPFLRHAAVMALSALNDMNAIEAAARDNSPAVRLGALLTLRRLKRPEVAMFLYDQKPQLILEAARAIYDLPIEQGLSQLASLINKPTIPKAAMRRALHANYRIGKLENAMALSEFAAATNFIPELRADAIELLGRWGAGNKRDLFVGLWRPVPARETRAASLTFRSELPKLVGSGPLEVRLAAVQAAAHLNIDAIGGELASIFARTNEPPQLRLAALRTLSETKSARLAEALKLAINDPDPAVRKFASSIQVRLSPADPTAAVLRMLETGSIPEKQSAFEVLGTMQGRAIDPVLVMWLDRVVSGKAPRELHLEILEAAARREDPLIKSQLQRFEQSRSRDSLAFYSEALHGGDAELGKKIFLERADVACLRCHKLHGVGGGQVGPDLDGVGKRLTREEILESIVFPNAKMTPGFENLLISMKGGATHAGLLRKEDAENIYIESPEDGPLKVPKAEIENLDLGLSSMPVDIAGMLTKRDLRNLVEFLAGQK